MKRLALALVALAVLPAASAAAPDRGTAVGIGLSEWEVSVYRTKAPLGKVRFNISNLGEDGHNFVVRTATGEVLKETPELSAGVQRTMAYRFKRAGRYELVCTLPGHEELGMKSSMKITKPKPEPKAEKKKKSKKSRKRKKNKRGKG